MPLEPTPERQLTPDDIEDSLFYEEVISTHCCNKTLQRQYTTLVKFFISKCEHYGRFCDECLIEFKDEIKVCN